MTTKVRRGASSPHQPNAYSLLPTKVAENEDDEAMDDAQDIDMTVNDASVAAHAPQPPSFFTTLVAPLLKLLNPTALSFPPLGSPSPHPPTTSALSAIHISALECLNNIFLSMATSLGGRPSGLAPENGRMVFDAVWRALGAVGTEISGAGQERRKDMWDIGVGVLWGVGNIWKGSLLPTEEHVQVLTQFYNATSDISVKVKTIGTLECLGQHPESVDANRVSTLLQVQSRSCSLSISLFPSCP